MKFNVIAVDFDGILWDGENKKPILKNVDNINKYFEDGLNFVVVYTSRQWSRFFYVKDILDKHNIKYHALVCEKLKASTYVDDLMERWN